MCAFRHSSVASLWSSTLTRPAAAKRFYTDSVFTVGHKEARYRKVSGVENDRNYSTPRSLKEQKAWSVTIR